MNLKLLILSIFLISLSLQSVFSQTIISPIQLVESVADRVIQHSRLELKTAIFKPNKSFQGIETVDFKRSFNTIKGTAYGYALIKSDKNQMVDFQVSHSDSLTIWVNGEMVYQQVDEADLTLKEEERSWALAHQFTAALNEGSNTLFVESTNFQHWDWKLMIQPLLPLPEEGDVNAPKASLSFSLIDHAQISEDVAQLTNWLILGPFAHKSAVTENLSADKEIRLAMLYETVNGIITWEIPKVELVTDVFGAHPLWGSLYDWNYHTAGLAWAIGNLGHFTGEQKYNDYLNDYCNFMLDISPYIEHEKYTINKLNSRFSRLWDSELLDFKVAPVLPYAYRLHMEDDFEKRAQYEALITETKHYLLEQQLRLSDGTLARETPLVHTVWVDDMFMGIPFMLQASLSTKDQKEQKSLLNQAAGQVLKFHEKLYDSGHDLYHHAWYSSRPEAKLPYWSRANGWGIWAASEVLLYLPKDHKHYKKILSVYQNHIKGLVKHQNIETGFYPQLLDEPSTFKETSGTAIFTMAIARGINQGWLNRKQYEPYAINGWKALSSVISNQGEVTDICMGTMCTEDKAYYRNRPVVENDSHGLLGLVFAGIEMQKLMEDKNSIK